MANRCLLPIKLLPEFEGWLVENGFTILTTKGVFEVLRAKKGSKLLSIYERMDAKEHLSVADKDYHIVRKFLTERKAAKNEQAP